MLKLINETNSILALIDTHTGNKCTAHIDSELGMEIMNDYCADCLSVLETIGNKRLCFQCHQQDFINAN